jgi:hypothetical protein
MGERICFMLSDLKGAMQQLEQNSTVDYVIALSLSDTTASILDEHYAAVLHHIRKRKHFRKFSLLNDDNNVVNVNPFLMAASENLGLQWLDLSCGRGYTAESLGRFRSHPNLRQLEVRLVFDQDIIYGFRQIIETCQNMQDLRFVVTNLSQNNWGPIREALYKTQRTITLSLSLETSDGPATDLLRSFLHDHRYPVYFVITINSRQMNPTWLSHVIGPAVQKLCTRATGIEVVKNFMESCQDREHLRNLEFESVNSLKEYEAIVDSIPHLLHVQLLRIQCNFSSTWSSRNDQLLGMKANLLRSLARNLSITDVVLRTQRISTKEDQKNTWTELEYTTLQSLKLRNSACSQIFASPDLIPLSLWPRMLRLVETTNAITSKSLNFQGLRGLSSNLTSSYGKHS